MKKLDKKVSVLMGLWLKSKQIFFPKQVSGMVKLSKNLSDGALLLIRIGIGGMLFFNHGIEKIFHYQEMLKWFPDPLQIGNKPGFIVAFLSDAVCSIFLILGFNTRIASAFIALNMLVALVLVHQGNIGEIHGELIVCYLCAIMLLSLTGPGKWSLDYFILIKKK